MTVPPRPQGALQSGFSPGERQRITKTGALLRSSKLDELPQFLNVLAGEMSIVGPRPETPEWTSIYPEQWRIVHSVRPGMTDEASILFRHEERLLATSEDPEGYYRMAILPKKLALACKYAEELSFSRDLGILYRTVLKLVELLFLNR